MADLLSTSISGLMAFQRALDTTSHNITNANTVGYSRQIAEFGTRNPQEAGNGWMGSGVDVNTIKRAYDDFLASQTRSASSSYNQFNTYATQAGRVSNLLGNTTTGLTASLQSFTNAFQAVADTPTSTPARQTLLSQAGTLMQRLQSYDQSLRSFDAQVNAQIRTEADSITSLARSIAKLNQEISGGYGRTGQPPNDLLDQRDRMIDELATHVSVNVVEQSDRSLNVFIGNGQPLVVGQTYGQIVATADAFDPTRTTLSFQTPGSTIDITRSLSGGTLGGMLDFRSQMLDPARSALGRVAAGLAEVVNEQHGAGMDLTGQLGGDFFTTGPARVLSHSANTGTGTITAQRIDGASGALTTSDYIMLNTASGWSLRRADTGATVPMTGTGVAGDPFIAEGIAIEVAPGAAVGDRFMIKPTAEAVSGMQVLITDPSRIAAAAPIRSGVGTGNTGTATISAGEVIDAGNAQLRSPVDITFTSATQYTISGDPTVYTYTPGSNIDVNGWRMQINGTPAAGDTFTMRDNVGGTGDNRNALKLASIMNEPVLNNGTASLSAAVGQFVGDIGVKTNQAQVSSAAQKVVFDESVDSLQSVSGVNLDEEAANLVRYQQAYMAAAQMIRVADTIFQSVLEATRG
ncbi:flagellar hook-associated protein FlgK [Povalibacter sp.]|uniref:flagellar hook-associated protein FlgK n=1 Tax=Povalibacter sp. TaxID=1962978 RepID=UPI002F3EE61C